MLVLVLALLTTPPLSAQTRQETETALARLTIERLNHGEFAAVEATFSEKLRAALPEQKLRTAWQRLQARAGKLTKMGEAKLKDRGKLRGVVLPTQFERRKIDIEVVFNEAGEIAGLLFD